MTDFIGTCRQCGRSWDMETGQYSIACPDSNLPLECMLDLAPKPPENLLFYDTETTGLPDWKADIMAPHQPRIIQLAAILTDPTGVVIGEFQALIKPDGWTVPEFITNLTGVTQEDCETEGIPMKEALERFHELELKARARLAYNNTFDEFLMNRESRIYNGKDLTSFIELVDVMELAKPICKLPASERMIKAGFGADFKPPKLIEAYQALFGRGFEKAHNALNDVRATIEVYFHIKKLEG